MQHRHSSREMKVFLQVAFLLVLQLFTPTYSFLSQQQPITATNPSFLTTRGGSSSSSSSLNMSKPFAVVVQAEIKPDRMDEFLKMIKNNAEESRKEPGCIRFGRSAGLQYMYMSTILFSI